MDSQELLRRARRHLAPWSPAGAGEAVSIEVMAEAGNGSPKKLPLKLATSERSNAGTSSRVKFGSLERFVGSVCPSISQGLKALYESKAGLAAVLAGDLWLSCLH